MKTTGKEIQEWKQFNKSLQSKRNHEHKLSSPFFSLSQNFLHTHTHTTKRKSLTHDSQFLRVLRGHGIVCLFTTQEFVMKLAHPANRIGRNGGDRIRRTNGALILEKNKKKRKKKLLTEENFSFLIQKPQHARNHHALHYFWRDIRSDSSHTLHAHSWNR